MLLRWRWRFATKMQLSTGTGCTGQWFRLRRRPACRASSVLMMYHGTRRRAGGSVRARVRRRAIRSRVRHGRCSVAAHENPTRCSTVSAVRGSSLRSGHAVHPGARAGASFPRKPGLAGPLSPGPGGGATRAGGHRARSAEGPDPAAAPAPAAARRAAGSAHSAPHDRLPAASFLAVAGDPDRDRGRATPDAARGSSCSATS
jgi:hypothetical protein